MDEKEERVVRISERLARTSKPEIRKPNIKKSKRAPLWLRVVLMFILLLIVAFAFYRNNLDIIERLSK